MKIIVILSISFLLGLECSAQNLIFVGNNAYKATQTWYFEGNGGQFEYYAKDATIKIGRNGQTGLFSISTKVYNASFGIKGSIRIYLDNATSIVLSKPIAKDFSDQYYTVIYLISSLDLIKLKESDINTIRFDSGLAGDLKGSTVSNRWDSNPDEMIYEKKHWATSLGITELFTK
jgi:hypothetical protein